MKVFLYSIVLSLIVSPYTLFPLSHGTLPKSLNRYELVSELTLLLTRYTSIPPFL